LRVFPIIGTVTMRGLEIKQENTPDPERAKNIYTSPSIMYASSSQYARPMEPSGAIFVLELRQIAGSR